MNEIEKIQARYKKRQDNGINEIYEKYPSYTHWSRSERELQMSLILKKHFGKTSDKKVLEIGAGLGDNIHFFHRCGFAWNNIYVNELLEERAQFLKSWFVKNQIYPGDILSAPIPEGSFDLIFQSVVFSSILDTAIQKQIVEKAERLLKPGGYFLWYDFVFDNPNNPDVKAIRLNQIQMLFSNFVIKEKRRVTLAPPIGRRVGRFYPFLNTLFPFLRTHLVILFEKRAA